MLTLHRRRPTPLATVGQAVTRHVCVEMVVPRPGLAAIPARLGPPYGQKGTRQDAAEEQGRPVVEVAGLAGRRPAAKAAGPAALARPRPAIGPATGPDTALVETRLQVVAVVDATAPGVPQVRRARAGGVVPDGRVPVAPSAEAGRRLAVVAGQGPDKGVVNVETGPHVAPCPGQVLAATTVETVVASEVVDAPVGHRPGRGPRPRAARRRVPAFFIRRVEKDCVYTFRGPDIGVVLYDGDLICLIFLLRRMRPP